MTPYYQDESVVIYHGDCREVLPMLALHDVGLFIADPPYGETSLSWDRWQTGWVDAIARQANTTFSFWCFGSLRMFMKHAVEFEQFRFAQDIVWEKHNGSSFHADRFKRVHEVCAHFYRGEWRDIYKRPLMVNEATKRTIRRRQRPSHMGAIGSGDSSRYASEDGGPKMERSVIYERSCHGRAEHPTEKPHRLLQRILSYSLAPSSSVLDPMCGSGSTLKATQAAGAKAIGIEINEHYCEIAANRCRQGALTEMFQP